MARLSAILRSVAGGCVGFWCPGCDGSHVIRVEGPGAWGWDRNAEAPTFTPSVLVQGGADNTRCHSFVRAGQIEFLTDCTHALAGKTAPLPPWPESFDDGSPASPEAAARETP